MTILEITATTFGPGRRGGGERHPTEFIRELSRHEPVMAGFALPDGEPAPIEPFVRIPAWFGGLPAAVSPTNPLPSFAAVGTLGAYLREHARDIEFVHVHNLRTAVSTLTLFLAYLRRKGGRMRILLTDHGARFFPVPSFTARLVDYWVPISSYSEELLQRLARHPSRVVPAAVTGSFLAGDCPPFASRTVDLLFTGRLVPWKRPEKVLDLAARLTRQLGRPVQVVLAGAELDPAFTAYLRRRAEVLHLGASVSIELGPTDERLRELYQHAKVYCFPSDIVDTFGRRHPFPELSSATLLEAAALGTPALANRIPASVEQVRSGSTGFVVDGLDSDQGVARAQELLEPGTWSDRSRDARRFVQSERTYPAIVATFREFLNAIRTGAP